MDEDTVTEVIPYREGSYCTKPYLLGQAGRTLEKQIRRSHAARDQGSHKVNSERGRPRSCELVGERATGSDRPEPSRQARPPSLRAAVLERVPKGTESINEKALALGRTAAREARNEP